VIEWGAGLVEQLSEDRLEVTLVADADTETRSVTLTGVGQRWT
jgi:tRNA threonylcarbamoyladenosine biosynthesis protein TsaE